MVRIRENKEVLIEAKTKKELEPYIAKYRALGYTKNGCVEWDWFNTKKPYYVFMRLKKW